MPVSMTPYRVFPDYRHIDPAFFTRHGIRLLLCDLDYTLAPKSQPEPDDALRRWLSEVQAAGVTVMILSNNRSPARVERFCRDLGITYEGHAGKPSPQGLLPRHGALRRSTGGDGHAGRQAADGHAGREPGGCSAADGGAAGRAAGCVESCAARPAKAVEGRQPEKTPAALTFFPRKHLPNGTLSCRIYKAYFGLVSFIQREWRYSLIHNGRNINYGNYYRR